MRMIPMIPAIPEPVAIADGSGASTKAHITRKTQNRVQTVIKTIWKLRSDILLICKKGSQR